MLSSQVIFLLALCTCEAFHSPFAALPRKNLLTRPTGKAPSVAPEDVRLDFSVGSLCEFDDGKGHVLIGKVTNSDHGVKQTRYDLETVDGRVVNVGAKQIHFVAPAPANPKKATAILKDIHKAFQSSSLELRTALDVDPDTVELAWEEANADAHGAWSPDDFIALIHSRPALDPAETYRMWRFLSLGMGQVFFKGMADHGRVTTFKAKAAAAVDTAKATFCSQHQKDEPEFCFV